MKARIRPVVILVLIALVAAVPAGWALAQYGDDALIPGLVGNFSATLLAFVIALAWEGDRRRADQVAERAKAKEAVRNELEEVKQEARKAFAQISAELNRLADALSDTLIENLLVTGYNLPNVTISMGAWRAVRGRLSMVSREVDLVADLGSLDAKVSRLEWLLQMRTEKFSTGAYMPVGSAAAKLIEEIKTDLDRLSLPIQQQAASPNVGAGLVHTGSATIVGKSVLGGSSGL